VELFNNLKTWMVYLESGWYWTNYYHDAMIFSHISLISHGEWSKSPEKLCMPVAVIQTSHRIAVVDHL
jgi:hypothetical protein